MVSGKRLYVLRTFLIFLVVLCSAGISAWVVFDLPQPVFAETGEDEDQAGPGDIWRSEELSILGIGMSMGDINGDGENEIVVIDPDTVYVYKYVNDKLVLLNEYQKRIFEMKSVDVAKVRKEGPPRIYVSAQNRATVSSFVLEHRKDRLVPVIEDFGYYVRVIDYPTRGPILLGQNKGMRKIYEGYIHRVKDTGTALSIGQRFGVPMKIPIFGFCIGDFEGNRQPLIAVYDRDDHLRVYRPDGKRLYLSEGYFGGSDIPLRRYGPEERRTDHDSYMDEEKEFFRPRIMSRDLDGDGVYEVLAITHTSATWGVLSRTKMLKEGRVVCLRWNGDAMVKQWETPKIQGMITDFDLGTLPGSSVKRLITLERVKTDWFSFLKSRSKIRAYDLNMLMNSRK